MKLAFGFVAAFATLTLASPRLAAQTRDLSHARTQAVPVTLAGVAVPEAQRVNDEAIITVGGVFHSSCDRSVHAQIESPDQHTHYVKAVAMTLIDFACSQYEREYTQEVSLGNLVEGVHQVIYESDDGALDAEEFTVAL